MNRRKIRVCRFNNPNRPNLKFAVGFREAGKRRRKFFETKDAAISFATFKNAERQREGITHSEFPTAIRIMAQNAVERLRPFGKTIADAVAHYVVHLEATKKSCTATELVRELLAAKKADGTGERHLWDIKSRLGKFAEKFNGRMVCTITSQEINDWLRSMPLSPLTRNHYRRLTVLAFNFADEQKYLGGLENPTSGKKIKRAKLIGDEAPGILKVSEAARLLEAATPDVLPYVAIGLFAGLRRAELERLDWSEIDFESDLIQVTAKKAKTAQRRFVTIQPNLRAWLLPMRQHSGYVTPQGRHFRDLFEQTRAAAGITDWPENALRHSFASYHLARFNDAAATALQLGHHDSRVTFAHYRELVRPKDAERYWNIKPAGRAQKIVEMVR
jgi:integrase